MTQREDPPYEPLSVCPWTHEDRQLSMAEGWSIESDGLRYQIVTWHPRSVQAVADDIRITEGYAHVAEDALGRAVRELDL